MELEWEIVCWSLSLCYRNGNGTICKGLLYGACPFKVNQMNHITVCVSIGQPFRSSGQSEKLFPLCSTVWLLRVCVHVLKALGSSNVFEKIVRATLILKVCTTIKLKVCTTIILQLQYQRRELIALDRYLCVASHEQWRPELLVLALTWWVNTMYINSTMVMCSERMLTSGIYIYTSISGTLCNISV